MIIPDMTMENFGPFKDRVKLDFRPTKLKDSGDMVMDLGNGGGMLFLSSCSVPTHREIQYHRYAVHRNQHAS